ncbi:MAG TPA: hypothetical protein VIS94_07360 [Desulfomonilia bacterium]
MEKKAPVPGGTNPVTRPGGIAINPITWTTDKIPATAEQNRGSIELNPATGGTPVFDAYGELLRVPDQADATAHSVVICSSVNPADYQFGFPLEVFHTFDNPFLSLQHQTESRRQDQPIIHRKRRWLTTVLH